MTYKKCYFCKKIKPANEFYRNRNSTDGYWSWCAECEKKFSKEEAERKKNDQWKNIVSFSGGKDSTAMLIVMLEEKIPIHDIVWFDCGEFEFPQMRKHIAKVESKLGVKVSQVKMDLSFSHYMYKHPRGSEKGLGYGWPSPHLRWCTNFKINEIKKYVRQYRPYNQAIGFAADEMKRVKKGNSANEKRGAFFHNFYPLVEKGITEKKALEICYSYGFDWDGLYNVFDRVSCWCCPMQGIDDLIKLKLNYPDMYRKLIYMNEKSRTQFKDDPAIWDKVDKRIEETSTILSLAV